MQNHAQQAIEKAQCSVCLEADANASTDGCEHTFCLRCIRKWAKTKNTCPLCRSQFLLIRTINRKYKVTPPLPPPPRQRLSIQNRAIPEPRRVIYIPILFSTQPLCYFFNPNPNAMLGQNLAISNMSQPIGLPSFFIPN